MNQETRQCQSCLASRDPAQRDKAQFVIEPDDFAFYEKMRVPPPTWCPECRRLRRLGWTGYRILYKRKCDHTGDNVISFYHPDAPYKVYRQDVWWSDVWDPKSYSRKYDLSKPFFKQFDELLRSVPLPTLQTEYGTMVQSEYCNGAATLKNCYLCFKSDDGEDCGYMNTTTNMKDSFDIGYSNFSELCYEILNVNKCYSTFYSEDCESSHDIYFSQDLVGCANCIGCIGLRNKNYHIFNRPVSKEEFEKTLAGLNLGSRKARGEFEQKVKQFFLTRPRKAFHGRANVDVSGDYIYNSKNVRDSYMMANAENIRYSELLKAGPSANSYDYTMFGLRAEWIYESSWVGLDVNTIIGGFWDYGAHHMEYTFGCHGSESLFGCVGIRKGEYCILNKQYTKDEYQELTAKIRKQMQDMPYVDAQGRTYSYGDFFPIEISPWTYNESHAMEFFPLTKEQALARGFAWRDPDDREYQDATAEIPDDIKNAHDGILDAILKCSTCGKNYRLIRAELEFYRRFNIPIPQNCSLCRDRARVGTLNPMEIHRRKCAKCQAPVKTSYPPERPEIVYCESCYNAEVA